MDPAGSCDIFLESLGQGEFKETTPTLAGKVSKRGKNIQKRTPMNENRENSCKKKPDAADSLGPGEKKPKEY